MAPVGGMRDSLRSEGWFAVLDEMSVPLLVSGDLLQGYDVMPGVPNRQVVVQHKGVYFYSHVMPNIRTQIAITLHY